MSISLLKLQMSFFCDYKKIISVYNEEFAFKQTENIL